MLTKIIARYLDKAESAALKEQLDGAGVKSIVRRHGVPRFLGGLITYQVQVERNDVERARAIVGQFTTKLQNERDLMTASLSRQCPLCHSENIRIHEKRSLLERFYYFGVVVRRCTDCGGEWYT